MKTSNIILFGAITFVLLSMAIVSAEGFGDNGYYNQETDECWIDENTPSGTPHGSNNSNNASFFQCCLNEEQIQVDCANSSIILYNDIVEENVTIEDKNKTKEEKNKTKEKQITLDAKTYKKYENKNNTIHKINLNNLSNALIYYENGTIIGSKIIKNNKNSINISLNPNETIYILNEFKLKEGEEIENSPIWFSYLSDKQVNISSNITDILTIDIQFNITKNCSDIGIIQFTSHSGNLSYSVPYQCYKGVITMELEGIEQALHSNTLIINEAELPSGVTSGGDSPSSPPIYDTEVAAAKSINDTINFKKNIDKIPVKIKEMYYWMKDNVLSIGARISPQNKERGAIILLVTIMVVIFGYMRYNEYFGLKYGRAKDRLFGKAYKKISKQERIKKTKFLTDI